MVLYSVELMDPCSIKTTRDKRESLAVRTRLELATYGVTGRYSNQLNYRTKVLYATCVRTLLFSKAGAKVLFFFDMTKFF